jgi:hypothetical protein
MKCPLDVGSAAGRDKLKLRNIKRTPADTTHSLYGDLMAENKTKPTRASVNRFINAVRDEQTRRDCKRLSDVDETQLVKMLETSFHSKGPAR